MPKKFTKMKEEKIRRGTAPQRFLGSELFRHKSSENGRKRKKPELFVQVSVVDDTRLEPAGAGAVRPASAVLSARCAGSI